MGSADKKKIKYVDTFFVRLVAKHIKANPLDGMEYQ